MQPTPISRDDVIARATELPAFPRIVVEILATLDDPDSSLELLAGHIKHDPVITARILAMANTAASMTRRLSMVRDVFTATSLIGLGRVRETALTTRLGSFVANLGGTGATGFWRHSVAVGVCSEELAHHVNLRTPGDLALVAGLLHDIGQLWLARFRPGDYRATWDDALAHTHDIVQAERAHLGIDHAEIGAWLAEHWGLPASIVSAIRHHHDAGNDEPELLVPLLHVAEVLSNALDLGGRPENRVTSISSTACARLGLVWNEEVRSMFGRIEARSAHANQIFAG
uniref:HDIG n=1 Tax=uncultured bacterium A1Q1_fos_1134 TaxID=1256543 RepID=L7VTU4_9BACT|nr:HDIG [uncultured bacterium A1Q1_fos_1134]